jgi:hypothetical protein
VQVGDDGDSLGVAGGKHDEHRLVGAQLCGLGSELAGDLLADGSLA